MKIRIKPNSITFEELKSAIVNQFPEYKFFEHKKNFIIAQKNIGIGCNIKLQRRSIIVRGNFPNPKYQIIYLILTIIFGFIYPILFYFLFINKFFRSFEFEIGNFLSDKYNLNNS